MERSPLECVAKGLSAHQAATAKRQIKAGTLKNASIISQQDHHAMVRFALDNCHAVCFGVPSSQGKGVGMGANSSPPLSQGLLTAMECQAIQSCIHAKAFQLTRSLRMTVRLMDDLLSASQVLERVRHCQDTYQCIDTTFDPRLVTVRGMFSNERDGEKEMQLNVEARMTDPPQRPSNHSHDVPFLNVSVSTEDGTTLDREPHSKRQHQKCDPMVFRRLTDPRSLTPESSRSGTMHSAFISILDRATRAQTFTREVAAEIVEHCNGGHKCLELIRITHNRLRKMRNSLNKWHPNKTVAMQHILWQVHQCWRRGLPLVDHRNQRCHHGPVPCRPQSHPPRVRSSDLTRR